MDKIEYYKSKLKEFKNQKDLLRKLRLEERMTYDEIGQIIGKSRTHVGTLLKEMGLSGTLIYPELELEETFEVPDEMIAAKLNIKESRVNAARKKILQKNPYSSRIQTRRRHFAHSLFGPGYTPGPKFSDFIKTQLEDFTPKKKELIEDFYLAGQSQSLSDNINLDADRVYRSAVKEELKEKIQKFSLKTLVREGVLKNGRGNHSEDNGI